jgi:hypothetical protein
VVVDRGPTGVTVLPDLRRWVAFRAFGAVRILRWIQAALEDVEGAIQQGQYGAAGVQARFFVLGCLSVRGLARGGEVDFDIDSVSFDFFAELTPDEVAAGLALANEAVDVDAESAGLWLERLQAYGAETEALLGYLEPLPVLRTPEGTFGLIGLARSWTPLLDELDLPQVLPREWTPAVPADR